jgi:hypothetical protein
MPVPVRWRAYKYFYSNLFTLVTDSSSALSSSAIVGIVVAGCIIFAVFLFFVSYYLRKQPIAGVGSPQSKMEMAFGYGSVSSPL